MIKKKRRLDKLDKRLKICLKVEIFQILHFRGIFCVLGVFFRAIFICMVTLQKPRGNALNDLVTCNILYVQYWL